MQYAEIIVNLPLSGKGLVQQHTYHYHIPDELLGQVQPGHLVIVSFGHHTVQGIVLAVSDTAPVAETKPVQKLVWPEPLLSPRQFTLAHWLSETYLTSLSVVLWYILPPGVGRKAVPQLALAENVAPPPTLSPAQQRLWQILLRGPRRLAQLPPDVAAPAIWRPLQRQKLLRRSLVVEDHTPRLVHDLLVQLVADPDQIADTLLQLGRPSKQADILAYLLATPDPLPTLKQVKRATACGNGPLRELVAKGWIAVETAQQLYLSPLGEAALTKQRERLQDKAPKQAAVLSLFLTDPRPKTSAEIYAVGGSRSALRTLKQSGLLVRYQQPAHVLRRLSEDETFEAIIALRGTKKERLVLDALLTEGEPAWVGWLYAETGCNRQTLNRLAAAGLVEFLKKRHFRDPLAGRVIGKEKAPPLLPHQRDAWQGIEKALRHPHGDSRRLLLWGPPGSGKTELYLRAADLVLRRGRQVLVLVPEIALAVQMVQRFARRFPGQVYLWHSELSAGERFDLWLRDQQGEAAIIVGTRSALFLPHPKLGLIVLDEEQDAAYKNLSAPRYHGRAVAAELATLSGSLLLAGSATPDVVTYHRAKQGVYQLLTLRERVLVPTRKREQVRTTAKLPPVTVVDMRQELQAGNRSIFSRALQQEMTRTLAAGEQAVLLLNRRGAATFVLCRDCGHVLKCEQCDVPLTFHADVTKPGGGELVCHFCGRHYPVPKRCPVCGSTRVRYFGGGTQRVEEDVHRLWPAAHTLRLDRDTVGRKGSRWTILEQFQSGQADVLVGTQMVSKGLDLPGVTLVGVISADTLFFLPDFRAAERTFQLLVQAAGRAGRSVRGGRVIVQTYRPDLYPILAAARHDFAAFYREELVWRQQSGYPPFSRLLLLTYAHPQERGAEQEARRLAGRLRQRIAAMAEPCVIVGPAPAFFSRLWGQYRWQIILRGSNPAAVLRQLSLPRGWRLDVDPASLV